MASQQDGTITRIRAILREHFAGEVGAIQPLVGGEFSRAFAFDAGGRGYVLRYSDSVLADEVYAKDEYAWRHFASPLLPIPRVFARGRAEGGGFAITERAAGRRVEEFTAAERAALVPSLLDTLDAIAEADVRGSHGYGPWDAEGNGEVASWRGYLAAVIDRHGLYSDLPALSMDERIALLRRNVTFQAIAAAGNAPYAPATQISAIIISARSGDAALGARDRALG